MSTLSQFFNSTTTSGAGGVTYFGTSGSLTVPSDVTYIAYGAIGAGSCGSIPGAAGSGAAGGFSWGESAVNCASPFNLTVTVGSSSANGGFSSVTGGPTTICATGGLSTCTGGIGYGGVINTCGGVGCYTPTGSGYGTGCYKYCYRSGGGAGGLFGNGGAAGNLGGGGFGSGGGGGYNAGYAGTFGVPNGGSGLNGDVGSPGFAVNYNLNGKLSQAKTFLSASGGGAGIKNIFGHPGGVCCFFSPAGAGGGGTSTFAAGFGGGAGSYNGNGTAVLAGCGGGGNSSAYYFCNCVDGYAQRSAIYSCAAGGNGFVAVEYWK